MDRILSERGINVHLFPIISNRWNKLDGNYVRKKNKKTIFIAQEESRWDLNCFKFMDFLSTYIKKEWDEYCYEGYGDTIINPNSELMRVVPLYGRYTNIYEIGGHYKPSAFNIYQTEYNIPIKVIKSFPSCKKMNINVIKDVLNKISKCKLKINYAIYSEGNKVINNIRRPSWQNMFSNMDETDLFQSFFDYEITSGTIGNNGKKYNTNIKIKFTSQLGAVFLHNIFSTGYCWIKEDIYSLSKNAQILYRRRFLPYTKAAQKVYLNIDPVFYLLGLNNSSNKTVALKLFKTIVEELIDNKFIKIKEVVNEASIITSKVTSKKKKPDIIDIEKYLKRA